MADEPRVFLAVTLRRDALDVHPQTWERDAPAWWRPRIGEWVEPNGESGNTYQVEAVTWIQDGIVIELEYTIGIGAPQSRWDEAYESLRNDGFAAEPE